MRIHQQVTVQILRNARSAVDRRSSRTSAVADSQKNAMRAGRVPSRIVTG
jgi:hypothetical protein